MSPICTIHTCRRADSSPGQGVLASDESPRRERASGFLSADQRGRVITESHVCPLVSSLHCLHFSIYFALLTACPCGARRGAGPGLQQGAKCPALPGECALAQLCRNMSSQVSLPCFPASTASLPPHRARTPAHPSQVLTGQTSLKKNNFIAFYREEEE